MHSQWLEAFIAVAKHGTISHAAADVHMSQSTLSRQITALETHLGAMLLTRQARGIQLTDAGRIVYSRAAGLLDQFQQLGETLAAEQDRGPVVRLGVPPGAPKQWLADKLSALEPYSFILNESTTNEQHDLLAAGQIDIALTHDRSADAASYVVLEQPLGVAIPDESALHQSIDTTGAIPVSSLDGMKVMAHSQAAIRSSEGSLRSLAVKADANVDWIFRRFSGHADLIARFSQAEGAITTSSSGLAQSTGWSWFPLTSQAQHVDDLNIRTWINWKPGQSTSVNDCAHGFIETST